MYSRHLEYLEDAKTTVQLDCQLDQLDKEKVLIAQLACTIDVLI